MELRDRTSRIQRDNSQAKLRTIYETVLRVKRRRFLSNESQCVLKKICEKALQEEIKQNFDLRDGSTRTYSQFALAQFPRQDILKKYLAA